MLLDKTSHQFDKTGFKQFSRPNIGNNLKIDKVVALKVVSVLFHFENYVSILVEVYRTQIGEIEILPADHSTSFILEICMFTYRLHRGYPSEWSTQVRGRGQKLNITSQLYCVKNGEGKSQKNGKSS